MYKLLLVDDDWTQLHILKRFIHEISDDFIVQGESEDGRQGLINLYEHPYDAVFTDIRMPVKNGLEFLKEIRSKKNAIPVILASTYSDFEYAKIGIENGVFDYVLKPFDKNQLTQVLDRLKIHLDQKALELVKSAEMSRTLHEKLDFGPGKEYQEQLLQALMTLSTEIDNLAELVYTVHSTYYPSDVFKTAISLENLLRDVRSNLLSQFTYVHEIHTQLIPDVDMLHVITTFDQLKVAFKHEIHKLYTFIASFHLNQTDSIVQKLCAFALTHINEKPTLESAAEALNYNSDYLGKLFKTKTREQYSKYYVRVKLEYGKTLLSDGVYKNYEISEMLGFKDVDYFSKLFKEFTGMTPTEFKRQQK